MKRFLTGILSVLLIFALAGCDAEAPDHPSSGGDGGAESPAESPPLPPEPEPPTVIAVPNGVTNGEVFSTYVVPIGISGLLYETWTTPADIPVDRLIEFYGCNEIYSQPEYIDADAYTPVEVEGDLVEQFMQQYFDVSMEYLRTAKIYDASRKCYVFMAGGRDVGSLPPIVSASRDGDVLSLSLVTDTDVGDTYRVTLNVLVSGKCWKYLSGSCDISRPDS